MHLALNGKQQTEHFDKDHGGARNVRLNLQMKIKH